MAGENLESTVLFEHRKVVAFRHILAIINFLAILAGTIVTMYYVQIRGISPDILALIRITLIINIIQIGLCIADYVSKFFLGKYHRWMVVASYIVGIIWLVVVIAELVLSSLALGSLRIDLAVIAGIQGITALIAYVIWPALDYLTIQQMTHPKVRDDLDKRGKKAGASVVRYMLICVLMVALQGGMLFAYKLPPKVYDIFAESRAIEYRLNEEGTAYEVVGVYEGTSSYVNIPAFYNNKPVTKILEGALVDDSILEQNRIKTIEFGTESVDENGNTVLVSNLNVIESGAIVNNNITSLTLPLSVYRIEEGAISSTSLKNVIYEAQADFSYSCLNTPAIQNITIEGEEAGRIVSLSGMANSVTINVAKDIYNTYRERNPQYVQSLRPIMPDDEFVVDFYTGTDYYVESIFQKIGQEVVIGYQDLRNDSYTGGMIAPSVDTLAYIRDNHELGTAGNKEASAFRGWYYDRALTQECRFTENGTVTFTSDSAIYAKWIDEYTGTLNWGTYVPDGQERTLYWTDEDMITFPIIEGRVGYTEGIKWYVGDSETQVLTSSNISENVTLNGRWALDLPVIDIEPYAQVTGDTSFVIATDKNTVSYTYDENQMVCLDSVMSHPLQGSTYNGISFSYSTDWTKVGDESYSKADSTVKMSTVPEEGDYILTVTVRSPYGETASAQTRIRVNIAKKALDMGTVTLSNYEGEYSPEFQTTSCTGAVGSERVGITYKYYDENDEEISVMTGVKNVGRYKVRAFFSKTDLREQLNYETRELIAEFVIIPKQLVFEGWTGTNLTYNNREQSVTMNVSGIQASDVVNITYEGNSATDAGEYQARAISVDNPNYSLDTIDNAGDCVCEWTISPKNVTVSEWKLDNSNLANFNITYDGNMHSVSAVMDGVIAGNSVNFIYDEQANTLSATDANNYKAKIIGVNNSNYKLDETNASQYEREWSIAKKQLVTTFTTDSNYEYNSTAKGVTANITGIVGKDVELFTNEKFLYDGTTTSLSVADPIYDGGKLVIRFSATNVSSYTASVSAIDTASDINKNYTLVGAQQEFTINPKRVVVENNNVYTYNGQTQSLFLTVRGITAQDIGSISLGQFTTTGIVGGSVSGNNFNLEVSGKNAGAYPATVTAFNNSNYELEVFDGALTINKKRLTPTWKVTNLANDNRTSTLSQAETLTYNYTGYEAFVELSGVVAGEVVDLDYVGQSVKNAGNYTTSASLPSSYENYQMTSTSVDWQVVPYVVNFAWNFNGEELNVSSTPSFTYNAQTINVEPVYELLGDDTTSITYVSGKNERSQINARNDAYEVSISSLSNANYSVGLNADFTWKINPREVVVNWVWNAQIRTVSYNGEYQGPAFTLDGLVDENRIIKTSIDLSPIDFNVVSISSTAQYDFSLTPNAVNVGTYVFNVDTINTDASTVDNNYIVTSSSFNLSIIKANLTLDNWSYVNASKGNGNYTTGTNLVYNTKPYIVSTSILTPLYSQNGTMDEVYLEYQNNEYTNYSQDGYTARVSLAGAQKDNYSINNNSYLNWNIQQKPITLEWEVTDFTYAKNTTKTQNASAFAGATSDDDNKVYDIDATSIVFTFANNSATDAGIYTAQATSISNTNYCFATPQTCQWEIKQQEIDVVWSASEFTYNGNNRYPTASYGSENLGITYDKETNSKNVGTYEISVFSITNNNYKISQASKTFTYEIKPVIATFTWGFDTNKNNASNFEYDGSERALYAYVSNSYSETLYLTYDIGYTKVNGSAGNVSDNKIKNAGTYVFRVTAITNAYGTINPNYVIQAESNAQKEINISQRIAKFTWGYNGDQSNATNFTYDGMQRLVSAYVSNARDAGITLGYNVSDAYRTVKNAGTYEFSVTSISNDNYTLSDTTKNKVITISPKPLSFAWYFDENGDGVYNGNDMPVSNFTYSSLVSHTVKAYATNLASGDTVNVVYNNADLSVKNAGTYNFEVTSIAGVSINNYTMSNATYTTKSITVNKQPVTITWEGNERVIVYDGKSHTVNATVKGSIDNQIVEFAYIGGNNSFTNAGNHTVQIMLADSSNYTTSGVTTITTLTIERKRAVVYWDDVTEYTYNKNQHTLEALVLGLNSTPLAVTYDSGNTLTNAGEKVVSISISDTNYYIDNEDRTCTLKVNQYPVNIKWVLDNEVQTNAYSTSYSLIYDKAQHTLIPQVTGFGGETVQATYGTSTITNVGTLTVTIQLGNSNYKLPSPDGAYSRSTASLTINPAPVVISWSENEFNYDGTDHEIIAEVKGVNNEAVNFSYADGNTLTDVGEKPVTVVLNNTNYTLVDNENATAILKVTKKTVQAKWYVDGTEATQNGNQFEITVQANGSRHNVTVEFVDEDGEILILGYEFVNNQVIYNPKTYILTLKRITDNNYELDEKTKTIVITVE